MEKKKPEYEPKSGNTANSKERFYSHKMSSLQKYYVNMLQSVAVMGKLVIKQNKLVVHNTTIP